MRFSGKTVLVTGSAGGIGKAIVSAFASEGARVIAADLQAQANREFAAELGEAVLPVELDVTSEEQWQALFKRADEEFGGIDALVNNAGFFRPNIAFEDMPLKLWRLHFAINLDGTFLGCKHAIRHMKARGGAVVNIGSGMSITASASSSAYCAAKAAVLMTTRTAAASAGRYNIRVNAVLPGAVPTPMLMGNLQAGQSEENLLAGLRQHSPLGRLALPEDIAAAVLFLADSGSAAITGIYLPVDGGNMPGA